MSTPREQGQEIVFSWPDKVFGVLLSGAIFSVIVLGLSSNLPPPPPPEVSHQDQLGSPEHGSVTATAKRTRSRTSAESGKSMSNDDEGPGVGKIAYLHRRRAGHRLTPFRQLLARNRRQRL